MLCYNNIIRYIFETKDVSIEKVSEGLEAMKYGISAIEVIYKMI